MATSSETVHSERTVLQEISDRLTRYDVVLAAIPLLFALVLPAHAVLPLSFQTAVVVGALTSSVLVADVIYLHPPTEPPADD